VICGICGRRMDSAWSNGKPAYRCRHGHTSAAPPDPDRAKNAYVREDCILARLPALYLLLTGAQGTRGRTRRRTRKGADVRPAISTEEAIGYLRERQISLTWDPAATTLRAGTSRAIRTATGKQANPGPSAPDPKGEKETRRPPSAGVSLRPGDIPACPETANYGVLVCPRGTASKNPWLLTTEFPLAGTT